MKKQKAKNPPKLRKKNRVRATAYPKANPLSSLMGANCDEWANYDFEQELQHEFDEEDCLDEVTQFESQFREDVIHMEELLFELPEIPEDISEEE